MAEMVVNNLTVDLLQDQAAVAVYKQGDPGSPGQSNRFTSINISVPISTPGNQPENQLKRAAIKEAKHALEEAIRTLEQYPV